MGKKVISIRIDEEVWVTSKKYALNMNLTLGELVEASLIHEMQRR